MKRFMMAVLLLAGATGAAQAGGSANASFDVSFVIRAACTVQADGNAPTVACSQGTGYQVVRPQAPAAAKDAPAAQAPSNATRSGDTWQIVF